MFPRRTNAAATTAFFELEHNPTAVTTMAAPAIYPSRHQGTHPRLPLACGHDPHAPLAPTTRSNTRGPRRAPTGTPAIPLRDSPTAWTSSTHTLCDRHGHPLCSRLPTHACTRHEPNASRSHTHGRRGLCPTHKPLSHSLEEHVVLDIAVDEEGLLRYLRLPRLRAVPMEMDAHPAVVALVASLPSVARRRLLPPSSWLKPPPRCRFRAYHYAAVSINCSSARSPQA